MFRNSSLLLEKSNSTKKVVSKLRKYGVLLINDFISRHDLESLRVEFEGIHSCKEDWSLNTDYSKGRCCRVNRIKMNSNNFPTTANVFGSKWMEKISNTYLGNESVLNHDIFLVHDVPESLHVAQDLHYDKIPTLKFFIYLTDTTSENGSFYCVPGSHKYTQKIEKKNRRKLITPEFCNTRKVPSHLNNNQIPLEGKAGTLIIFDTDVFHRAGKVDKGERFVMRGHSRKEKFIPGFTPTSKTYRLTNILIKLKKNFSHTNS